MKLSIIISTHNRIKELTRCLDLVNKQTFSDYEILIIDQNSSLPGIDELVSKYPKAEYYKFKKNLGPCIARNFASKKAKGEFILFLDDDAFIFDENILKSVIEIAEENNYGQIGCQSFADEDKKNIHYSQCVIDDDGFLNKEKSKNINLNLENERVIIETSFCLMKKDVFFEVGGFDPAYFFYDEDTDLSLRVQAAGYKNFCSRDLKYLHVSGSRIRSANSRYFNKNYLVYKNFGALIFTKNLLKNVASIMSKPTLPNYLDQSKKIKFQINLIKNYKNIALRKKINFLQAPDEYEEKNRKLIREYLDNIEKTEKKLSRNNNKTAFVYITNRCNAKCQHCFYYDELNKQVDEMTLADYKNLARVLEKEVNQVIITGGEPFIRKDIEEISKYFLKNPFIHSLNYITNGVLPDRVEEKVTKILHYASRNTRILVNISIDGMEKTHEKIRRVPGIFTKCLETISRLKKLQKTYPNLQISALTTIQKENFSDFVKINKFVEDELDIYHRINIIRSPKTGAFGLSKKVREDSFDPAWVKPFDLLELNSEEHKNVLDYFMNKDNWRDYHKFVLYYSYYIKKNGTKFFECSAPYDNLVIYPNGDIAFCEYTKTFGNVKNAKEFNDFWKSDNADIFRKHLKACSCDHPCNIGGNLAKNPQLSNILPEYSPSPYTG